MVNKLIIVICDALPCGTVTWQYLPNENDKRYLHVTSTDLTAPQAFAEMLGD